MTPILHDQLIRMQGLRQAAVSCAVLLLLCGCNRSAPTDTNTKAMREASEHQAIDEFQSLMNSRDYDALFAQRDRIEVLTASENPLLSRSAFATLMTVDGYVDPAWELAWSNADGFTNLLAAMPLLEDAHLRIALADRSLPLLDDESLSLLSGWPNERRLASRKAVIASLALVPGRKEEIQSALESARNEPALREEAISALKQIAEFPMKANGLTSRKLQRQYKMADLEPLLEWPEGSRSFARGRRVYHELGCQRCHVLSEHDTLVGTNLWDPKYKPSRSELVEAIIHPDKEIPANYRQYMLVVNGKPITGLVTEQTDDYLIVISDPMHDCTPQRIERDELDDDPEPLTTSAMPSGMVDVLTLEELLDLLAYVETKADPENKSFRQGESP